MCLAPSIGNLDWENLPSDEKKKIKKKVKERQETLKQQLKDTNDAADIIEKHEKKARSRKT
jgi:hypothetical protein